MYQRRPRYPRDAGLGTYVPPKVIKGLLEDGIWLCDCEPRKPALCLTVKKDNSNKGKRFYTCDSRQCGFFLWESEAKKREQEALLKNNCPSENGIVARVQAKGEEAPLPAAFVSKYNGGASSSRTKQAKGKESVAAATTDNTTSSLPKQRLFTGRPPPPPPAKKGGAKATSILSQDSEYLSWDSAGDDDEDEDEIAGNATKNSIISKSKSHGSLHSRNGGSSVSSVTLQNSPKDVRSRTPAPAGGREMTGPTAAPQTPSAKRKRAGFVIDEEDSDEYGGDEFDDPALSQELAQVTEASARKLQQHERYGGGGIPLAFAETPTTGLKRFSSLGGGGGSSLPTPTTGGSRIGGGRGAAGGNEADNENDYGNIAKKLRFNNEAVAAAAATRRGGRDSHLGKDPETPTPYRKTDVFAPGATRTTTANTTPDITSATSLFTTLKRQQQQQQQQKPTVNASTIDTPAAKPTTATAVPPDLDTRLLSSEIKDLLSTSSHTFAMPDSIRTDLDAILERYERRVRGLIKGRDAARAALEARDARIAELQTRIAGLENARRMDRESLRDVRRGLLKLSQLSDDEQAEQQRD